MGAFIDPSDVVALVHTLVDKSMVVRDRTHLGTRYRLLETMRQYAEERLLERGETATVRDRHVGHVVELAERLDWCSRGRDQVVENARFAAEWNNIANAHHWALETGRLDAAQRLIDAAYLHSVLFMRHNYRTWALATLAAEEAAHAVRDHTLAELCSWASLDGGDVDAMAFARRALDLSPDPHQPYMVPCWSMSCATSPLVERNSAAAREAFDHLEMCLARITDPDHDWWWYIILAHPFAVSTIPAVTHSPRCPLPPG